MPGLEGALDCGCAVRPGGRRVFVGYYRLCQNSTVQGRASGGRAATFRDLGPSVVAPDGLSGSGSRTGTCGLPDQRFGRRWRSSSMVAEVTESNPNLPRTLSTASVSRRNRLRSGRSKRSGSSAVPRLVAAMPISRTPRSRCRTSSECAAKQRPRREVELRVEVGSRLQRLPPGDGAEIVVPQLHRHRPSQDLLIPQLRGDSCREQGEYPLQLRRIPDVIGDRGFPADRFRQPVGPEGGSTLTLGPELERARIGADEPFERALLHLLHLMHLDQPELGPPLRCLGPDSRHRAQGQPSQESLLPAGPDLHQAPRLGTVGGELGNHPVGARCRRCNRGRSHTVPGRAAAPPPAAAKSGRAARCRQSRDRPRPARPSPPWARTPPARSAPPGTRHDSG